MRLRANWKRGGARDGLSASTRRLPAAAEMRVAVRAVLAAVAELRLHRLHRFAARKRLARARDELRFALEDRR
jgi:hypothetical protein